MEAIWSLLFPVTWIAYSISFGYVLLAGLGTVLRSAIGRPAPRTGRIRRATILLVTTAIIGPLLGGSPFVFFAIWYSAWIAWYSLIALVTLDLFGVPWLSVWMVLGECLVLWLYINGTFGRWIAAARRRRLARREVIWNARSSAPGAE